MDTLLHHANRVMAQLGMGHREGIYAKALNVSLNKARVFHRTEVDIPIMFERECVGHGRADLIIDDLIVEIKAVQRLPKDAMAQLDKYVTNLSVVERQRFRGVVLNFCQSTGVVSVYQPVNSVKRVRGGEPPVIKRSRFFVK